MSDFAGSSYTTAPPRYGYGLHPNDPRMHAHFYHGCVATSRWSVGLRWERRSMPGGPETAWQRRQATRVGVILPSLFVLVVMSLSSSRRQQADRARLRNLENQRRRSRGRGRRKQEERSVGDGV
jgi:hypothetical protein